MNVVFATDNNYAQHCLVALTSLLVHNNDVHVFIIVPADFSMSLKEKFEQCAKSNNANLDWIIIPDSFVAKLPLPPGQNIAHISLATYYRLFLAELLPEEVDRVLYLDCDIVIKDSLYDLWVKDLTNFALAACEVFDNNFAIENSIYSRLDIPHDYNYFNAGVLVINVDYWRNMGVQARLLQYAYSYYSRIVYHDQDILNGVLYKETKYFQERFNMQRMVENGENDYSFMNPAIIHFSSTPKPWTYGCGHFWKNEYFNYLDKTPYKGWRPSFNLCDWYKYIGRPKLRTIYHLIKSKI